MKKTELKLNCQHDYISLKMPIGTFTVSRSGAKASGELVTIAGAFETLDNYVHKTSGKTVGEAMEDLTKPEFLATLIPNWNKPTVADTFVDGDTAEFIQGIFKKKYPSTYKVNKIKGKYVFLEVPNKKGVMEVVGFEAIAIKKIIL